MATVLRSGGRRKYGGSAQCAVAWRGVATCRMVRRTRVWPTYHYDGHRVSLLAVAPVLVTLSETTYTCPQQLLFCYFEAKNRLKNQIER